MFAFALLLGLLAAQDAEVTLTLTDGTSVRGTLEGYEDGRYRLLVNGAVEEVDERQVMSVEGKASPHSVPAPVPEGALPQGGTARLMLTDGSTVIGELAGYEDGRYTVVVGTEVETIEESRVLGVELSFSSEAGAAPESAAAMNRMDCEGAVRKIAETLRMAEQDRRRALQDASGDLKKIQEHQRLALDDAADRYAATQDEYRRSLQDTTRMLREMEEQQRRTLQDAADHFAALQEEYRRSAQDISDKITGVDQKQARSIGEVNAVLRDMRQESTRELHEMVGRLYEAYIAKLIAESARTGDGSALTDMFGTMATSFSQDIQREIIRRMGRIFVEKATASPGDASAVAFLESANRLPRMNPAAQTLRTVLSDTFIDMGRRQAERGDFGGAMTLYRAVLTADPSRRDSLSAEVVKVALAHARDRAAKEDNAGASAAAGLALEMDPANEEGRILLQEAMAKTLAPADALPTDTHPQLRRYFPVRPGQYIRYSRPHSDLMVEVVTDKIEREDQVTKVTYVYNDIYRNWSTSKRYQLEIESDAIIMATGVDREPVLRFPVHIGQSWSWKTRSQQFTRRVTAVGTTAEVGAPGRRIRFPNCLVVEFTSSSEAGGKVSSLTSRSTYAAEVGLIKLEFLSSDQDKFNLELMEYGIR